jgi:hypothetical protein
VAVSAEGRGDEVALVERGTDADCGGLLPLALVDGAGHRPLEKEELDPLLELPDQDHALVKRQEEVAVAALDRVGRMLVGGAGLFLHS